MSCLLADKEVKRNNESMRLSQELSYEFMEWELTSWKKYFSFICFQVRKRVEKIYVYRRVFPEIFTIMFCQHK